jgi:amidase
VTVRRPTYDELLAAASSNHFHLSDEEIAVYANLIDESLRSFDRLDHLTDRPSSSSSKRRSGYRPSPAENPYGGWAWRCSIRGPESGSLSGKRVALKDVISVDGVPLRQGSVVMRDFVSDTDATIVSRLLEAGAEIAGKANCESFCFSGSSNTSYPEPVRNPHDPTRMTGGSSSGCAALLASGACDIAIGCDQGGSIREPSAYCGVFGLKPTFGLVPYTGIASMEPTLDHAGPMARTVADIAAALQVIAGRDELDPRTSAAPDPIPDYMSVLRRGCKGMSIGILREGFNWPKASEADVEEGVRRAMLRFRELGADVHDVSIPLHRDAGHIFNAIVTEGAWSTMFRDAGAGRGWSGYHDTHQLEFMQRALLARGNDLPHQAKLVAVLAAYLVEHHGGHYYAKSQNLRRQLIQAYDDCLSHVDLLAMPTVPQKAIAFDDTRPLQEEIFLSGNMNQNTAPFSLTGHPAISVPCGFAQQLPIGMMLVGRRWDESTLLRAAAAFESLEPARLPTASAV